MAKLTLLSTRDHPLQPLVEAALANELRFLEAGIQRTEQRLSEFEHKHQMSTAEFVARYENDELPETFEFAEWIGEHGCSRGCGKRPIRRKRSHLWIEAYFQQIQDAVAACCDHHKKLNLPTYPHHKHEGSEENVVASPVLDLATVLNEVERLVQLPS